MREKSLKEIRISLLNLIARKIVEKLSKHGKLRVKVEKLKISQLKWNKIKK